MLLIPMKNEGLQIITTQYCEAQLGDINNYTTATENISS